VSNKIGEVAKDVSGNIQRSFSWLYHMERLIAFARGGAASTTIDYSFAGRLTGVTTTDPRGVVTLRQYNASNDFAAQYADTIGVASDSSFEYEVIFNLASVTDPIGAYTAYGYDGLGSRKTEASPAMGATTWTDDNTGNEKTRRDTQLNTVTTTYPGKWSCRWRHIWRCSGTI
jgi:YD repeat-containing protein